MTGRYIDLTDSEAIRIRRLQLAEEIDAITLQLDELPPYPRFSPEYDLWHTSALYARSEKKNEYRRLGVIRDRLVKAAAAPRGAPQSKPLSVKARGMSLALIQRSYELMKRLSVEGVEFDDNELDLCAALEDFLRAHGGKVWKDRHLP